MSILILIIVLFQNLADAARSNEQRLEKLSSIWKTYEQTDDFVRTWLTKADKFIVQQSLDPQALDSYVSFFDSCPNERMDKLEASLKELLPYVSEGQGCSLQSEVDALKDLWKVRSWSRLLLRLMSHWTLI